MVLRAHARAREAATARPLGPSMVVRSDIDLTRVDEPSVHGGSQVTPGEQRRRSLPGHIHPHPRLLKSPDGARLPGRSIGRVRRRPACSQRPPHPPRDAVRCGAAWSRVGTGATGRPASSPASLEADDPRLVARGPSGRDGPPGRRGSMGGSAGRGGHVVADDEQTAHGERQTCDRETSDQRREPVERGRAALVRRDDDRRDGLAGVDSIRDVAAVGSASDDGRLRRRAWREALTTIAGS